MKLVCTLYVHTHTTIMTSTNSSNLIEFSGYIHVLCNILSKTLHRNIAVWKLHLSTHWKEFSKCFHNLSFSFQWNKIQLTICQHITWNWGAQHPHFLSCISPKAANVCSVAHTHQCNIFKYLQLVYHTAL